MFWKKGEEMVGKPCSHRMASPKLSPTKLWASGFIVFWTSVAQSVEWEHIGARRWLLLIMDEGILRAGDGTVVQDGCRRCCYAGGEALHSCPHCLQAALCLSQVHRYLGSFALGSLSPQLLLCIFLAQDFYYLSHSFGHSSKAQWVALLSHRLWGL